MLDEKRWMKCLSTFQILLLYNFWKNQTQIVLITFCKHLINDYKIINLKKDEQNDKRVRNFGV